MTTLSTTAPDLAPAAVEALALAASTASRVPPGRWPASVTSTCLVQASDGSRCVFKISNPSEPAEVVDFQIAALDHIARVSPDQPVPRVVAEHWKDTRTARLRSPRAFRLAYGC